MLRTEQLDDRGHRVVSLPVAEAESVYRIPPPFVPSGGLVCNNCGFVRLHALLPLSIDPKEKGGVP